MNLAKKNAPKKITASRDRSQESPDSTKVENNLESEQQKRQQPIPPPSHPRQYRAIGLIKGKYQQDEQMTQGNIVTPEGTKIEAVVLGRVISLLKNHLDLASDHVWVVYPRTKVEEDRLHVQIVGVWEPETLDKHSDSERNSEDVEDGYFSIRGEAIFFSIEERVTIVKIKQFPRKEGDKPKFFKLKLKGILGDKPLRRFWDIKAHLEGESLKIDEGTDLGFAQKRKPNKFNKNRKKIPSKPSKPRKPNTAATSRPILPKKPKD